MKLIIAAAALVVALSGTSLAADDGQLLTCALWNQMDSPLKGSYLTGLREGSLVESLLRGDETKSKLADVIFIKVTGTDIDRACALRESAALPIAGLLRLYAMQRQVK